MNRENACSAQRNKLPDNNIVHDTTRLSWGQLLLRARYRLISQIT